MPKSKGMEYWDEYIILEDLSTRLAELSLENWELVTVTAVHANTFELGERAHVLVVLKRPVKN